VVLKRLIVATASIALMATPAMAAGSSAAAASQASSTATPATESVDGTEAFGGRCNIAVILAALIAVALGIYFLVKDHDNPPASP
jgi:hypothetical protein